MRIGVTAVKPEGDAEPNHHLSGTFAFSLPQLTFFQFFGEVNFTYQPFEALDRSRPIDLPCNSDAFASTLLIAASLLGDVFQHHNPGREAAFFED